MHSCDSQRGWENGGGLESHTMGGEKNSDLRQDSSPVQCGILRAWLLFASAICPQNSCSFICIHLHTRSLFPKTGSSGLRMSVSPIVVSGLTARAWPGNFLEKHTFELHPQYTVSQTLERAPGIRGSLSPKGEKIVVSATTKDQSKGVRSQLTM